MRILRVARAAAANDLFRLAHWTFSCPTRRMYASCTREAGWMVERFIQKARIELLVQLRSTGLIHRDLRIA